MSRDVLGRFGTCRNALGGVSGGFFYILGVLLGFWDTFFLHFGTF